MPFAPPYSPTKDFSQDESVNASGRSTVNTSALDAEFANIEVSVNHLNANLQEIQRDDNELRDFIIKPRMLSDAARALISGGWNPRGVWGPGISYAVRDFVEHNSMCYVCALAHTSNVFTAESSFWLGVSSVADVVALTERAESAAIQATTSATSANNSASSAATSATHAANRAASIAGSVNAAANCALLAEQPNPAAGASVTCATNSAVQADASRVAAQIAAASVNPNNLVHRTGDESVDGIKAFLVSPLLPGNATQALQAVPKQQMDTGLQEQWQAVLNLFASKSHTSSGYQDLPGGLILQCGVSNIIPSVSAAVPSFTHAFPNGCLQIVAIYADAAGATPVLGNPFLMRTPTKTTFTIFNGGTGSAQYRYISIGF